MLCVCELSLLTNAISTKIMFILYFYENMLKDFLYAWRHPHGTRQHAETVFSGFATHSNISSKARIFLLVDLREDFFADLGSGAKRKL